MSYISQTDLETRLTPDELIQLADLDEDGEADSAVIARAIADAEGVVDSYVGARTAVPLTTVPDSIRAACVTLAIYNLYLSRRSVPADVLEQYKNVIAWLRDISAGKATLGDADNVAGPASPTVEHQSDERVWTREKTRGW